MEGNKPKVLVASPVYSGMKYCMNQFLDSLRNLDYENYDIVIFDNSRDNKFFDELQKEEGLKAVKDDCKEDQNILRLISSRNKIIDYAIKNKYDYILMMDCDVIAPKEAINDLIECNKEIVSGIYYNVFFSGGRLKVLPVCWMPITKEEFEEMQKQNPFPEFVKSHLDLRRHMLAEEAESNELLKVFHPSGGCLLISHKVFENARYGLVDMNNQGNLNTSDDIYFIKQAKELGFEPYCYTKVKCEHLALGKYSNDENGKAFNPLWNK